MYFSATSSRTRPELSRPFAGVLLLILLVGSPVQAASDHSAAPAQPTVESKEGAYVPGELLVKFRPDILNRDWLESRAVKIDFGAAIIDDPLVRSELESLLTNASPLDKTRSGSWILERVFERLRPSHEYSLARGGEIVEIPDLYNLMLLKLAPDTDLPQLIEELSEVEGIEYAEPNYLLTPHGAPNDALYSLQDSLEDSSDRDLDAERAWDVSVGSSSIRVGVIDTGIDYHNPDLGGSFGGSGSKVRGGWDFFSNDSDPDDEWDDSQGRHSHGTKVAGVIGALRNNSIGIAGLAGGNGGSNIGVQLFAFKVGGTSGGLPTGDIIDAILEASLSPPSGYGCDVLNMSFGSYNFSHSMRSVIGTAADNNVVAVAAKGNDGVATKHYPSDYDKWWVISVGASDENDTREQNQTWGSNYGNDIDVMAPGVDNMVRTTARIENGTYGSFAGTSAAAPHVSGIAALLLSVDPSLHSSDVQGIVKASAEKVRTDIYAYDTTGWNSQMGFGRVNAADALDMLSSPWTLTRATTTGGSWSHAGTEYDLPIVPIWGFGNPVYGYAYRVRSTVNFPTTYSSEPFVWGRGANASLGWGRTSPVHSVDHCEVVSSTSTSAVLDTYVYDVYEYDYNSGSTYARGWFPTTRSNAKCAYSVLGTPGAPPIPPEPTACFTVTPTWGNSPLTVTVDASCSSDSDGTITNYTWTMGEGSTRGGQSFSFTYYGVDTYTITLTVTDDDGLTDTDIRTVVVTCEEGIECPL